GGDAPEAPVGAGRPAADRGDRQAEEDRGGHQRQPAHRADHDSSRHWRFPPLAVAQLPALMMTGHQQIRACLELFGAPWSKVSGDVNPPRSSFLSDHNPARMSAEVGFAAFTVPSTRSNSLADTHPVTAVPSIVVPGA